MLGERTGKKRAVRAALEKRWLDENRAAIEAYNRRVACYGLLSDETGATLTDEAVGAPSRPACIPPKGG